MNYTYSEREAFINILKNDPCDIFAANSMGSCNSCPYKHLLDITSIASKNEQGFSVEGSCFEERYADHLINKGAVIPPVDVGDKVWYIEGGYYNASYMRPQEIEVTEINKKKSGKTVEWGFIANHTRYKFSSFGKTVFWSKKDCEVAIEKKKRSSKKFI